LKQFSKLKLYRPTDGFILPAAGTPEGKNVCFIYVSENDSFLKSYRSLGIKKQHVRYLFVPTTKKPITKLTSEYRKAAMAHGLRPIKGFAGEFSDFVGKNFFYDINTFIRYATKKFNFTRFNTGRSVSYINRIVNTATNISTESFERVLLYSVNLDENIPNKIFKRKVFPIYSMLVNWVKGNIEELPFDKLLLHVYDHTSRRYVLLFDKNEKPNLGRIRNILKKLKSIDEDLVEEEEVDILSSEISQDNAPIIKNDEISEEANIVNQEILKDVVRNYLDSDPSMSSDVDTIDKEETMTAAIVYHVTGNMDKAKFIAKQVAKDPIKKKKLIRTYSEMMIPRRKVTTTSTDEITKMSKPSSLVDNQVPTHVLDKRKNDFKKLLKKDIVTTFKRLETLDPPLKLKSIKSEVIKSGPEQLKERIIDRYNIELIGKDRRLHKLYIDLPHLTENGTFLVNGQNKILVTQLITYPIFFFKPYHGKFESSYSVITIISKRLKSTSYLIMHISGYKFPIMAPLAYLLGFDEMLKYFKMSYYISKENIPGSIKLSNTEYIVFNTKDEIGEEIVESLKHIPLPTNNFNIKSKDFWMEVLIKYTGTRNCFNGIDKIWTNIVTPIEVEVLKSKGDPTKLPAIIKYICKEVIAGTVDDRNGIDKQRIRTSEVFTHILEKQIPRAYSEYAEKRARGDKTAQFTIVPTKAFSEVQQSQNVQQLENINPMEELSMMTRITPIGIGGVSNVDTFPMAGRNIHSTYYGNIDPLETPDGPGVGIQQHLSVGVALSNNRGMFMVKDSSTVKPTEILSTGPALIPFVESNDGCRVLMGTAHSKQSIPLANPQPAAVQTGYESLLTNLLSDNFVKKSPADGTVISVSTNLITIRDSKGKKHNIDTTARELKSGQGKSGLSEFKHLVSVGDKVKKDKIISEGASIINGMISTGLNVLTAYMPWKGYNFEDGIVVSESIAKLFTSRHIEKEVIYLEKDHDVVFIEKVGNEMEKGGILITYSDEATDVESFKHLRSKEGIINNIKIYSNVNEEKIPKVLIPQYKEFKDFYIKAKGSYPEGKFKEKNEKFEGIMIEFYIEQRLELKKADKLSNRHGGKGVIGLIEKDENMPITPDGERIDMVFNPIGVINRMNSGQMLELHTGMIAKKLGSLAGSMPRGGFTSIYERVLKLMDGTRNKEYSRNVFKKFKSLSDKNYQKIIGQIKNRGYIPIIIPPFKSPAREDILKAMTLLGLSPRIPLFLPEYKKKTKPVAVGLAYVHKLEHLADKKMASRGTGPYTGKTFGPTQGKKRDGGQKVSEYDMYSLLAWNAPYMIEEFFGPLSSDHSTKNVMISEIIQTGKTRFRPATTNPEKDLLTQMMMAIHLEAT